MRNLGDVLHRHAAPLLGVAMLAGVSVADVLVVGAGPQADFNQIADAVAAAADGDTILVNPGDYARFALDDRELQIVGIGTSASNKRVLGLVRIRNLGSGKVVRISGLRFQGLRDEGLWIYDNAGQVFLQDCQVFGSDGINVLDGPHDDGYAGVVVEGSAGVSLTDCVVRGGNGDSVEDWPNQWGVPTNGGTALWVEGSSVTVHACEVRGGWGGHDLDGPGSSGANGGHGVVGRAGASIWLHGSTLEGGRGGDQQFTFNCWDAGNGGHGLFLSEEQGGVSVQRLDTAFTGGEAGTTCGSSYYAGSPGLDQLVRSGNTVTNLPGSASHLGVVGLSDQDPVSVQLEGPVGAHVWAVVSREPAWRPRPRGVLLLGSPLLGLRGATGTIPASGVLTFPLAIPPGAPAGSLLGIQALVVEPGSRTLTGVRWHFRR